jgi:arylformamidase
MRFVDLTHPIQDGIATYPGSLPPRFEWHSTFETKRRLSSYFTISTHTGTHVDAPLHFIPGGKSIDQIDLDQLCGWANIIDLRGIRTYDRVIDAVEFKNKCRGLKPGVITLFYTGLKAKLGSEVFLKEFNILDSCSMEYLVSLPIKALGIDAVSIDKFEDVEFVNHKTILSAGIPIIEGLANLNQLVNQGGFRFTAAPLILSGREAAPCRAFASLDSNIKQDLRNE